MRLSKYISVIFGLVMLATTAQAVTKYEAEAGTLGGSATLGACGCSGGYNVENLGGPSHGTLNLTVVSRTAKIETLTVAYDNGLGSSLSSDVIVNGVSAGTLSMPDTGGWSMIVSVTISIPLNAGTNTIRFAGVGSGWVGEIDYISLPDNAPDTTKYEGEAGSLGGSTTLGACAWCSGGYNVENLGGPSHGTLALTVVSRSTHTVTMSVAYDNGSGSNLSANVIVNGTSAGTLAMPDTGGWSTIVAATISVPLNVGTNTIEFAGIGSGWVAEIDYISFLGTAPSVINLNTYGTVGTSDDTTVFQNAINDTATNRNILEIPAGSYIVQPLSLPAHTNIIVDDYATVTAKTGYTILQRMINITDVQHVTITGNVAHPERAVFHMLKAEYTTDEQRHCLYINGSTNVTIAGISCNDSGGDGIYIGEGTLGYSSRVNVFNSIFDNNRRQGMSLISGKHIYVTQNVFSNTNGTAPEAGVDVEPNQTSDVLQDVIFTGNTATGNAGDGMMVSTGQLNYTSAAISVDIESNTSASNGLSGYVVSNGHDDGTAGVTGTVTVHNSSSTNDAVYGAVCSFCDAGSIATLFDTITVTNPNSSSTTYDDAAVGVKRGGGATLNMGGVTITGLNVSATNGKVGHYFTVEDFSNVGLQTISIGSFGTLSGSFGAMNGVLNGTEVSSVSIP